MSLVAIVGGAGRRRGVPPRPCGRWWRLRMRAQDRFPICSQNRIPGTKERTATIVSPDLVRLSGAEGLELTDIVDMWGL